MAGEAFLESYGGQSTAELIALEGSHRIDSIVLAFEQALQAKLEREPVSDEERVVLAVEALEREVNNGGYHQFLVNSSNEHAEVIVEALRRIDCPATAAITEQALAAIGFTAAMTPGEIAEFATDHYDDLAQALGRCDDRYYAGDEPIAQRLFEWIKLNRAKIRIAAG
jgi:putative ribosome biogenesis GTPase RsgA